MEITHRLLIFNIKWLNNDFCAITKDRSNPYDW